MAMKWWGWGEEQKSFPLSDPERFWSFLRERLGDVSARPRLQSLDQVVLPPSPLEADALSPLRRIAGDALVATDSGERAVHSLGKGYRDLVRIRRGEMPNPIDAVVYPETDEQVAAILAAASEPAYPSSPSAAGRPSSAASSRWATGRRSPWTWRAWTACSTSSDVGHGDGRGGHTRAGAGGAAQRRRLHPRSLPAVI